MIEIRQRCNVISSQLSTDGDITKCLTDEMVKELNWYSEAYGGRVLVVSPKLEILVDTYNIDKGKTCVSKEVFDAILGTEHSMNKKSSNYVEFVLPVKVSNNQNTAVSGVLIFTSTTEWIVKTGIDNTKLFILAEAILLFICILFSVIVVYLLMKPVKKVAEQVQKISEGSAEVDFDHIKTYDEIHQVMHSAGGVIKKYQDMEQSRQEFVSNVSHELKTPMTSIRVLADSMIGQEGIPEEMYQEFLQDISLEVERESHIIEDLLTMVRMEKNTNTMNITQLNINDFVVGIMKRLKPIAAEREIELIYESFRQVSAAVDEIKLGQAFTNLIENAVKYNIDGGWVRVSLDADHKYFYFKVADCGVGIPEDALEHVFDRFYRVDKARSRETGGTGLGLSIAKNFVLMHYGIIKVESQLGEGTTFTVRIPLTHVKD